LSRRVVDLLELARVAACIEQNTLIYVALQQLTHFCGVGRRQQACPNVFRTDRIGLLRLIVLALVVSGDGHRKAEPDNEAEQRQRSGKDDAEIFVLGLFRLSSPSVKVGADLSREP